MTTQLAGSRRQAPALGVARTGIAFGCLLGAMHLGWVILVAVGLAQPIADFVYWLHFIRPVWVIEPFEPFRALGLVVLTAAIGYLIGSTLALIWNRLDRARS